MNLLSIIFPQTIYKTASKFSGEIKVIDHVFERRMSIGGLTQSGGILYGMWEKALDEVDRKQIIKNVLILGLGAGTAAEIISTQWPKAKIVGIEIDPEIVSIGKTYFKLSQIKNLTVHTTDAISFVKKINKKYDLVLVDLYTGYLIERRLLDTYFLRKINQILSNNGVVIYNVLPIQKTHFEASKFLDKIRIIFQYKFYRKIVTNTFIFASKHH